METTATQITRVGTPGIGELKHLAGAAALHRIRIGRGRAAIVQA